MQLQDASDPRAVSSYLLDLWSQILRKTVRLAMTSSTAEAIR